MKNKNNKGFSLIELIVVIAIMAVLVGVMAPAYLRYVEKARRQTCYTNMDNVVREVQLLAFSDPDFMDDLMDQAGNPDNPTVLNTYISTNTDVIIPTCPSRGTYELTFNTDTGVLTMSCSMDIHGLPSEGDMSGNGTGNES